MKRKIGIVTLNGYFNFGNRLQNFALQTFLEKLDFDVETIRLDKETKSFRLFIFRKLKYLKELILNKDKFSMRKNREKIFKRFSLNNIKETAKEYSIYSDLSFLNNSYDFFVIGSDQVWNPYMNGKSGAFFCNFATQEKVISYAASFGISKLPEDIKEKYKSYLSNIKDISVRESAGVSIVKDTIDRDAKLLVDPTLLISKDEWIKLTPKKDFITPEKYLLTYFLGEIPNEYSKRIKYYSKKYNLEVINIGNPTDKNTYEMGPAEFIHYINNSTLFCTDSFHGCVFSIILEKPFIVFKRLGKEDMFSRIETLLSLFNLFDREISNINENNLFRIDYSNSKTIISTEIEKSREFILKNLK